MCRSNSNRCSRHSCRTASPRITTLPAVDVSQALVLRSHELVFTGVAQPVDPENKLKHILVDVIGDIGDALLQEAGERAQVLLQVSSLLCTCWFTV